MPAERKVLPRFSLEALRAWRMRRQRLAGARTDFGAQELLDDVGWLYAAGNSTPYLSAWLRSPGCEPHQLDGELLAGTVVLLTGVRGAQIIVSRDQASLAHQSWRGNHRAQMDRLRRHGVDIVQRPMRQLMDLAEETLRDGPLQLRELRQGMPPELLVDFGAPGESMGLPDNLALGLGLLMDRGVVVRSSAPGVRLDGGVEPIYALTQDLLDEPALDTYTDGELPLHLASYYFDVHGPARLTDFAWWAALPLASAQYALEVLAGDFELVQIEDEREPFYIPRRQFDFFVGASDDEEALNAVALLPNDDPCCRWTEEPGLFHVEPRFADLPFARWAGRPLRSRILAPVMVGGLVCGMWEWAAEQRQVGVYLFDEESIDPAAIELIAVEAERLENFIKEQLEGFFVPFTQAHAEQLIWRIDDLQQLRVL